MKEKFTSLVKKRFGSIARFAEVAGLDYYELQKLFAAATKKMTPERKEKFKELIELAKSIPKDTKTKNDLTPELRQQIKDAIEAKGGVSMFVIRHPEFSAFSIWQILNGSRKSISKTVKKLLSTLEINTENEKVSS